MLFIFILAPLSLSFERTTSICSIFEYSISILLFVNAPAINKVPASILSPIIPPLAELNSSTPSINNVDVPTDTLNAIHCWNEYQDSTEKTLVNKSNISRKYRDWNWFSSNKITRQI